MSSNGMRRNRIETEQFYQAVIATIEQAGPPVTLRQLFYAMLPLGLYEKEERSYKNLAFHTAEMRRAGLIPYGWFSDSTRRMHKPRTYTGLEQMLEIASETYRRALWADLNVYCEIWCEKEALSASFYRVTGAYDVPLMVTKGFSSMSFTYEAAEAIKAIGKQTFIYYFGDFDPSGLLISQDLERKLRAHGAEVEFERVAVNEEQIAEWRLPTRPTKRGGSHAKGFASDESVELDAVPPAQLRALIEDCIVQRVPAGEIEGLQRIEEQERETLRAVVEGLRESNGGESG
jgi:hypothetical protein